MIIAYCVVCARCGSGECIIEAWKCDGILDCEAGEDEAKCTYVADHTPEVRHANTDSIFCHKTTKPAGNCTVLLINAFSQVVYVQLIEDFDAVVQFFMAVHSRSVQNKLLCTRNNIADFKVVILLY